MLGSRFRGAASLLVAVVVSASLAGCQPARPGARCNTTEFGDDGAHWVLECRNGRWQWLITKRQVAQLVLAAEAAKQAAGPDAVVAGNPAPRDDYPVAWRNAPISSTFDWWSFPNRQCTSFVAFRLAATMGKRLPVAVGDAHEWDDRLAPFARIDGTPAVGAIAHWNANESAGGLTAGPIGHVGWVQAVYADGSALVEQYNLGNDGRYVQYRTRAGRYIHL